MASCPKNLVIVAILLITTTSLVVFGEAPRELPADSADDLRAVRFSNSEEAATRELNELAKQGWRYVGPIGNGLVAFQRDVRVTDAAAALQGEWEYVAFERHGVATEYDAKQRMTLLISEDRWTVGPSPGAGVSHQVEIRGNELIFHGVANLGGVAGDTTPPPTRAWGVYELSGETLVYCMSPNEPDTPSAPGLGRTPNAKTVSFETQGTENTLYRLRRKSAPSPHRE